MRYLMLASLNFLCLITSAYAQTNTPEKPSSVQETYQDWQVVCVPREKTKSCVAVQQQSKKENNQRVLVIEFAYGANNTLSGTLVMPFGLLLADGVTLQVDEKPASKPYPIRTCLPVGCVVPLALDKSSLDLMRAGASLKITANASDSGQQVQLAAPLKGLAPALDRLRELMTAENSSNPRK